jgi:hypothetical protein
MFQLSIAGVFPCSLQLIAVVVESYNIGSKGASNLTSWATHTAPHILQIRHEIKGEDKNIV